MNRLLRIEWNKLFYNKGTRIFLILYFILIGIMGLILPNFKQNFNGIEVNFLKLGALNFPVIWHNITWLIGFGKFFLAIIVINNITNEYAFGTFKQNIIDGLTKREFLLSKILMNLLFTLASTTLILVIVIGVGAVFSAKFEPLNGVEFIVGYFIEIFAYIALAMFLSFLLKKSTFAILALFVFKIIESIVYGLEIFIRTKSNSIDEDSLFISNLLPLSSNSKIIDLPPGSITQYMMSGNFFEKSTLGWEYFATSVIYIIVFLGLSYLIIKKRDL